MIRKWLLLLKQYGRRVDKEMVIRDLVLIFIGWLWVIIAPFINEMMRPGQFVELAKQINGNWVVWVLLALPFLLLIEMIVFINNIDKRERKKEDKKFSNLNIQIGTLNGNILSLKDDMHRDLLKMTDAIEKLLLGIRGDRKG